MQYVWRRVAIDAVQGDALSINADAKKQADLQQGNGERRPGARDHNLGAVAGVVGIWLA